MFKKLTQKQKQGIAKQKQRSWELKQERREKIKIISAGVFNGVLWAFFWWTILVILFSLLFLPIIKVFLSLFFVSML